VKTTRQISQVVGSLICALACSVTVAPAADPLPSWNDTAPEKAIVAFVENESSHHAPRDESFFETSRGA
jgi:hypothetical protein